MALSGQEAVLNRVRLANAAAVFVTPDVRRTADYYREVFGFSVVEHYDAEEAFAAIYRDDVEIILVQAEHGDFRPNRDLYGAGYDLYIDPDTVRGRGRAVRGIEVGGCPDRS